MHIQMMVLYIFYHPDTRARRKALPRELRS